MRVVTVVLNLALVEHGQGEGRYVEDMVFPTYASRMPLLQPEIARVLSNPQTSSPPPTHTHTKKEKITIVICTNH